jgi:hypothetical protein
MLSPTDNKSITSNVTSYYQLAECNTHMLGEPFLLNNYLYYFDGDIATLISMRLKGKITSQNLNNTIFKIIKKHSPQNLIIWGETPSTNISRQNGYKLSKHNPAVQEKEMVFDTSDFVPSKKYKRYLKRAKEEKLQLKILKPNCYKASYTKLFMETHKNRLSPQEVSYYGMFPHINSVKFMEITKGSELLAVKLITAVDKRYVCLTEVGYNQKFKSSSGLSTALAIDYYLDKTKYLSWGICANKGIYDFKRWLLGKTKLYFYENLIWYEFYKKEKATWWYMKMLKNN